ncbi:hypothetical protein NE237_016446 [Protea cynaroides]|uniref:Uncharacterized protein n=1 Tax=Protea cynaroides TaxID=273540 RepID=A0A9Q0HDV9_9MAGN|nr:hypothetical protein NE237_016446 [Protea cynaroides]
MAGADEVLAVVAPQAKASSFTELRDLLANAHSIVTTLDDYQHSLKIRLDAHERRMLQNITGAEQWEIALERRFIAFEATQEVTRQEITFLQAALTKADLIEPMPEDMKLGKASQEHRRQRRLQAVAPARATYSVDSPRHQVDRFSTVKYLVISFLPLLYLSGYILS